MFKKQYRKTKSTRLHQSRCGEEKKRGVITEIKNELALDYNIK